ncbi:hypothetical protein F7Q99_30680 [Streptomyces kaniharaensis]|uniref:Uncharacterized protein n=1 Tax=Streptomyces kaniharaensis TaxID=212423 RepID=A0A6N7L2L8_9ACTN|nr:hypothetical protein [Streptomyces kaniharaensis]MQS16444.1 hypothetical protein [Streptomyces kaniharaensis]
MGNDLQVPGWPLVTIVLSADGSAQVDGNPVAVPPGEEARSAAFAHAVATAARIGRPVRVKLTDTDGAEWVLAAHPDGGETTLEKPSSSRRRGAKQKQQTPKPPKQPKPPKEPRAKIAPKRQTTPPTPAQSSSRLEDLLTVVESQAQPPAAPAAALASENTLEAAIDAGDWTTVAAQLKPLKADPRQADRVAELEAQLAAVRGDIAASAVQYTALALARSQTVGPDHPSTHHAADRANDLWHRIADPQQALQTGRALLNLRQIVPPSDPTSLVQLRLRLARLHVS